MLALAQAPTGEHLGPRSRRAFRLLARISAAPPMTPKCAEGANFAHHHRNDDRGAGISWRAGVARHVLLRGVDGVAIRLRIHLAHSYVGALRGSDRGAARGRAVLRRAACASGLRGARRVRAHPRALLVPPRAVWYGGWTSTPRPASTWSSPPPRTRSPRSPSTCGRRANRATVRSRSR